MTWKRQTHQQHLASYLIVIPYDHDDPPHSLLLNWKRNCYLKHSKTGFKWPTSCSQSPGVDTARTGECNSPPSYFYRIRKLRALTLKPNEDNLQQFQWKCSALSCTQWVLMHTCVQIPYVHTRCQTPTRSQSCTTRTNAGTTSPHPD